MTTTSTSPQELEWSGRDPRWRQVLPSSELVPWRRRWPVLPTHVHGPLSCGSL